MRIEYHFMSDAEQSDVVVIPVVSKTPSISFSVKVLIQAGQERLIKYVLSTGRSPSVI